jgi:hypothetical protein
MPAMSGVGPVAMIKRDCTYSKTLFGNAVATLEVVGG